MNRRAFSLAGPLGALAVWFGLRTQPEPALKEYVITSVWPEGAHSLVRGEVITFYDRFEEVERVAGKLALVRK